MIGIMLATALMTAVVTMAVSFQKSLVSYEKKEIGRFSLCIFATGSGTDGKD